MALLASLPRPAPAGVVDVPAWRDELAHHDGRDLTPAELIDEITHLEELKAAAAAAQARLIVQYDEARRTSARPSLKQDPTRLSRVIAGEIALARRVSPSRGQQHLGAALAWVKEMPHTMAALTRGEISEWRATIMVKETACLTREDRARVDQELAGDLPHLGDRKLGDKARAIAYRLDPGAALRRGSKAEKDRRVTVRPAPDTMSHLSGLLPVAQGVAAYAALRQEAEARRAAGDPRTLNQLMADLFVARLTDQPDADAPKPPDVEIQLVMPERTLMRGSHEPAHLRGFGPVPASLARRLVREADKAWIRRLYAAPTTGELVAMDSRRRTFTGQLREFIVLREQTCRNAWCDAVVRHTDHIRRVADGGATTADNGQGLCEACNYLKEEWRTDVVNGRGPVVEITTWTGHRYRSGAPPLPGAGPPTSPEQILRHILDESA